MLRSPGGIGLTSCPPITTLPSLGCSSPAISRKIVDLPQPEGPTSVRNSLSSTDRPQVFLPAQSCGCRLWLSLAVRVWPWFFGGWLFAFENVREEGSKRGREQERERAREGESKRGREQERERAREGESKRGREQERERSKGGGKKEGERAGGGCWNWVSGVGGRGVG